MIHKGIAASDGYAVAKVFKYEVPDINIEKKTHDNFEASLQQLEQAMEQSLKEIEKIKTHTAKTINQESADIFEAHMQIIKDPEMKKEVIALMEKEGYTSGYAYQLVTEKFIDIFKALEDSYMQERAADIFDVSRRVLAHYLGKSIPNPKEIDEDTIIVAHDLTPSDTAQLDKRYIKGIITEVGGRTSHSAIMSRMLEIPAIVGAKEALSHINDGSIVALDGIKGEFIINPDQVIQNDYSNKHQEFLKEKEKLKSLISKNTVTKDNRHVEVAANIGSYEDIEMVVKNGAEGVGLYRTEFLYMHSKNLPGETVQFEAYKKVLQAMDSNKVIIRTLDIGGDKNLDYISFDKEMNPFLGNRAIRLCFSEIEIFKTQLRALLRASVHGNLHIMFPMIATVEELKKAKSILKECEASLIKEGYEIGNYKVGIMIEIPSTVMIASHLAKHCDFFSIGTNDLIQYTFAADRMNESVSYLYQPFHPSIIKQLKMVIDASHEAGIWTGMCGEMAQEFKALPILLGLGLDEFSMSPSSVLKSRDEIRKMSFEKTKSMVEEILQYEDSKSVLNRLEANDFYG